MGTQPTPPRRRRWPWLVAAAALLALIALTAVALWSRTEHALATVARAAERALNGRLELKGVAGTLYGPITVQRLEYRDAGFELKVDQLGLHWSPQALLAATVRVDRLTIESMTVKPAGGAGAATPPASLRVPIRIALRDLRVGRLMVVSGETQLDIAPVAASATLGLTRHSLVVQELGTPWARVSGEVSVGARAPFRLKGRASLRELKAVPLESADVSVNGNLSRIHLALTPKAHWLAGSVAGVVAPFSSALLQGITAALTDVNLARLDPALPATRATVKAELGFAGDVLSGAVTLENALAGRIDAGRVPLSAASGAARFDGSRLRVDDLKLALAGAGSASGWAEAGIHGYAMELATAGVRLDRLHAALQPLTLAGSVRVASEGDGARVQARLKEGDYALKLSARWQETRIDVDSATVRAPGGDVTVIGELLLNEKRAFKANAHLKGFDPGHFVVMPPARLTGALELKGALRPEWRVELAYRIADSRFAGAAMVGEGRMTLEAGRITVAVASLAVGANRARAAGVLGAAGDRLNVDIDAPALARLGLGASGTLRLNGWIGGTAANLAFAIDAEGREVMFRGAGAAALSLSARATEGLQGNLTARIDARGLQAAGRSLARMEATLEGTRRQHALRIRIDDPVLGANVRARGSLDDAGGWEATIEMLDAARPYRARLLEPVGLRWRASRLETGAGRLAIAGGTLFFEELVAGAGVLASRGRLERVALGDLVTTRGPGAAFRTDLVVSGAWDIRAADVLNGSLHLERDSGDVMLTGEMPVALGIGALRLEVVVRDNAVEATLQGQGERIGMLGAELRTRAERSAGAWVVAPEAPLALRARFSIPSLAWLGPLLNRELHTDGRVEARVVADGTLRSPRLEGELSGENLSVRYGAAGVRLRDGETRVALAQEKVIFQRIAFRGDEGSLTANGSATFAGHRAQLNLDFRADKLAAVRRDDHQLVVSGSGRVRSSDGRLALEGEFTADRGLIELRAEDAPRLSSDVVIVSDEPRADSVPARLRIDVTLNLGQAFRVRGEGLDVRMEGGVRVTLEEGEVRPRARGSVRVAEGHYNAYGQQLAIERGVLFFDGPLDNPKLDILAVRKNQRVEAGVAITGTALSPRTALYSKPPVPDSQKLRWLMFGAGPGSAGDAEFGLASSSTQPQQDEFVSVGAQLASAVYVSVGQSLRSTDTFVQATLELTERIAVQGRTGSENAVTLIYTWEFD